MRPLLIDENVKAQLAQLKAYADAHPMSLEDLKLVIEGKAPCAGDIQGHVIEIHFGYKIVLSVEDQPNIGLCWHVSISVPGGKWPNEHAVDLLCQELLGQPMKNAILTWTDPETYPQSINLLFRK